MKWNPDLVRLAANDPGFQGQAAASIRRAFSVEFDRRGVFVTVGRFDAYLCTEPGSAWAFLREPGGFDAQVWRLHLIVGRAPR